MKPNKQRLMNSYAKHFSLLLLAATGTAFAAAQSDKNLQLPPDDTKAPAVILPADTVTVSYLDTLVNIPVASNCDYTLRASFPKGTEPWFTYKKQKAQRVRLVSSFSYENTERYAQLHFDMPDGNSRNLTVRQAPNQSANTLTGDEQLGISSATASKAQPGYGIEKSYDGSTSTTYESPWSSNQLPVTLTYTLKGYQHVDYLVYVPRIDGNINGNFGRVTVEYTTRNAPQTFTKLGDFDFKESATASQVRFGENGIDDVQKVRITVNSGGNGYATVSEMRFFAHNRAEQAAFADYFEDALCTKLKSGIDQNSLKKIAHPFVKSLVSTLLRGNYPTKYRVGEFEPYRSISSLAGELKTSGYNPYENPTGIYFKAGQKVAVFVEGLGDDGASLVIKNFGQTYEGEPQSESAYPLSNGVNIITPANRGNGYISYYTDNAAAPNIRIHFAMADVNGYFDLERGDTNEDWKALLANACSDIIDMRTKRIQVAYPTARFKQYCPNNGVELALISDSVIYREREILGLVHYNKEPKNRQFARVVWGGFMFADGTGAAAHDNSIEGWMNPDRNAFGYWGIAHELGHVNQVRPGLKWVGCGETTNNIYAAWVQFSMGGGWNRLEDENSGVDDYGGDAFGWTKGGRFNVNLELGVRQGIAWQLQDGPDYHGGAFEDRTVRNEDYNGHTLPTDTTVKFRNFDHFVKLVPFWQLQLYCHQAGYSPNIYAKVIEAIRNTDYTGMSNGQIQLHFIRLVCDSSRTNFLPFFEKSGMLRPINAFIADYSSEWLKISPKMIQDLKDYVKAKGYPTPEAEVNYISSHNWKTYADKLPLEGTLNQGCSVVSRGNVSRIQISHEAWRNVAAFETYDADGNLLRISMQGLGGPQNGNTYTQVLWPQTSKEKAVYIMAVGWNGTRMKCYEP